jgi:hypothetical protein
MPEKLIGVFLPNQPKDTEPSYYIPLQQAHILRRQGRAKFVDHRRNIRLEKDVNRNEDTNTSPLPVPRSLHGASCVIDEKPQPTYNGMMTRFVEGDYFARAAVYAWRSDTPAARISRPVTTTKGIDGLFRGSPFQCKAN